MKKGFLIGLFALVLTWTDNSTNEQGFIVERAPAKDGVYEEIGRTAANVKTFTDDNWVEGSCYRVRAYNSIGASAPSAVTTASCAIRPVAPSNTKNTLQ